MKYYGIVEAVKNEHKFGVYQREIPEVSLPVGIVGGYLSGEGKLNAKVKALYEWFHREFDRKKLEVIEDGNKRSPVKELRFKKEGFFGDYKIDDQQELFYGLFDGFVSKSKALRTIMESYGGSELVILDQNEAHKRFDHHGGDEGTFESGLYVPHPRKPTVLIPLKEVNLLMEKYILEHSIRVFESLGAKSVFIEEVTSIGSKISTTLKTKKTSTETTIRKEHRELRQQNFDPGTFDVGRARKSLRFVSDIPEIGTIAESRIDGNLSRIEFTEEVNVSVNVDANVLDLFRGNVGYNVKREWHFIVEFYDRNLTTGQKSSAVSRGRRAP